MNSVQMSVYKRLTIVDTLGSAADGNSLRGLNVNDLPDGALVYVTTANRFYRLRKNLNVLVVADAGVWHNVVDAVGSSAVNGRFVAVNQYATGTLVATGGGSVVTIAGFDLSAPGAFLVSYTSPGGTQGFIHANIASGGTSVTSALVTSSSATDTSVVLVSYLSEPVS